MSDTVREWQALAADEPQIARANIIAVDESTDQTRVRVLIGEHEEIDCEVLSTVLRQASLLVPGDAVLIWRSGHEGEMPVVLGRIGAHSSHEPEAAVPNELVLEAKQSLTLRVGAGSITIREDGKILIKGNDLVSHAKRLNRIKGGAVQIN